MPIWGEMAYPLKIEGCDGKELVQTTTVLLVTVLCHISRTMHSLIWDGLMIIIDLISYEHGMSY